MLTHENFSRYLNEEFSVYINEDLNVNLKLEEISEFMVSARQEHFWIVFRGPNDVFLDQGLRRFSHESMGEFELFIVPIGQDQNGFMYQSIFNRLRKNEPESAASA